MRYAISFILFILPAIGFGGSASEVHKCIQKTSETFDIKEREALAQDCFQTAKLFKNSESLEERSLYFTSWHLLLQIQNINSLDQLKIIPAQLYPYFEKSIKPAISKETASLMTDITLATVYPAIGTMDFYLKYGPNSSAFEKKLILWNEKIARRQADDQEAQDIVIDFVRTHHWDTAREIVLQFPTIVPRYVPAVVENELPAQDEVGFYSLSPDRKLFTLHKFEFRKGPQLIMVGFCHFAWDAIEEMSAFDEIRNAMKNFGILLVPPDFVEFDTVGDIRDLHPEFSPHWAYSFDSWGQKGIEMDGSPTFYFLLDGKLKGTLRGWGRELFCRESQKIGLSLPKDCFDRSDR